MTIIIIVISGPAPLWMEIRKLTGAMDETEFIVLQYWRVGDGVRVFDVDVGPIRQDGDLLILGPLAVPFL
jgi:hypothetical protein